jgi:hypothetical protein
MPAAKAMQPFTNRPQCIAESYYRCGNLAINKLAMTSSAIATIGGCRSGSARDSEQILIDNQAAKIDRIQYEQQRLLVQEAYFLIHFLVARPDESTGGCSAPSRGRSWLA